SQGEDYLEVSYLTGTLGNIQLNRGLYEQAEETFRRGLAIRLRRLKPDHPRIPVAHMNISTALLGQENWEGACAELALAQDVLERTQAADDGRLGFTFMKQGICQFHLGRLDEALDSSERGRAILSKRFGPQHSFVAEALTTEAQIHDARDNVQVAAERFEQAVAAWALQPPNSQLGQRALASAREFAQRRGVEIPGLAPEANGAANP
ncbi:MAG: tetratricopeptide repeat protein, partial [Pseudomonadota bacterium]